MSISLTVGPFIFVANESKNVIVRMPLKKERSLWVLVRTRNIEVIKTAFAETRYSSRDLIVALINAIDINRLETAKFLLTILSKNYDEKFTKEAKKYGFFNNLIFFIRSHPGNFLILPSDFNELLSRAFTQSNIAMIKLLVSFGARVYLDHVAEYTKSRNIQTEILEYLAFLGVNLTIFSKNIAYQGVMHDRVDLIDASCKIGIDMPALLKECYKYGRRKLINYLKLNYNINVENTEPAFIYFNSINRKVLIAKHYAILYLKRL